MSLPPSEARIKSHLSWNDSPLHISHPEYLYLRLFKTWSFLDKLRRTLTIKEKMKPNAILLFHVQEPLYNYKGLW